MSLEERVKFAEMKARHAKEIRPWYKKWWGVILLVIASFILIIIAAVAYYFFTQVHMYSQEIKSGKSTASTADYKKLVDGESQDYATGTSSPKITIVEFTDFACPFCQESATVIRSVTEKYQDSVRLVIRDYPIHDQSISMAVFARCAGEQGQYFKAYDYLFANQDELKASTDLDNDLLSLADHIGLDTAKYKTCYENRSFLDSIKQDYYDGNSLEISGTPTWYINYYPLTGYYSADKFEELIQGALQQISGKSGTGTASSATTK